MSEFNCVAVRLPKIGKHPKADKLDIVSIFGYPVILQSGTFNKGDLAVHIPPDALVDTTREEFSWLADKAKSDGTHRVKFIKLRGIPSFGFLVPCPEGFQEGQNLQEYFGITKYEPPIKAGCEGHIQFGPPAGVAPHYDIEGMRKYGYVLKEGEQVNVTEKIHGMNARWVFTDGNLFCGSRTQFRKDSIWNQMAEKYGLEAILRNHPGLTLYGEIYGKGIQDLEYGLDDVRVVFFDAYDSKKGLWLEVWELMAVLVENKLPQCPILYEGPYLPEKMKELAEGKTILGKEAHVREGIVIKPVVGRYDAEIGRAFLKIAGEGYLSRKDG